MFQGDLSELRVAVVWSSGIGDKQWGRSGSSAGHGDSRVGSVFRSVQSRAVQPGMIQYLCIRHCVCVLFRQRYTDVEENDDDDEVLDVSGCSAWTQHKAPTQRIEGLRNGT